MKSVVTVFGESVRLYRAHGRALLATAALMMAPIGAVMVLIALAAGPLAARGVQTSEGLLSYGDGAVELLGLVATFLTQAALVAALAWALDETRWTFRSAWRGSLERAWPVLTSGLAWLVRLIGWMFVAWAVTVPLRGLLGQHRPIGAVVVAVVLTLRYSLVACVAVLEGLTGHAALRRSAALLRGRFGLALGTTGLLTLASIALSAAIRSLGPVYSALYDMTLGCVLAPLEAAVLVVLYRSAVAKTAEANDAETDAMNPVAADGTTVPPR